MAYRLTADLNTSGSVQTIQSPVTIVSCTVRNSAQAVLTVTDNRGQTYTTQPGSARTFDISPSSQITYQSSANVPSAGSQIIYSDDPLPDETTSQALPPGGVVTIQGNASVVVAPGQTIGITGNPNFTVSNANINVTDATVGTNTGNTATNTQQLLAARGSTRVTLTSNNTPVTSAAMLVPVQRFTVQVKTFRRAGLLTILTIGPGVNNNTVLDSVYVAGAPKIPWAFDENVPPGFQIEIFFTGDADFSVSY